MLTVQWPQSCEDTRSTVSLPCQLCLVNNQTIYKLYKSTKDYMTFIFTDLYPSVWRICGSRGSWCSRKSPLGAQTASDHLTDSNNYFRRLINGLFFHLFAIFVQMEAVTLTFWSPQMTFPSLLEFLCSDLSKFQFQVDIVWLKVENDFDLFIENGSDLSFDVSLIFAASFLKAFSISFSFVSIPPNILFMEECVNSSIARHLLWLLSKAF